MQEEPERETSSVEKFAGEFRHTWAMLQVLASIALPTVAGLAAFFWGDAGMPLSIVCVEVAFVLFLAATFHWFHHQSRYSTSVNTIFLAGVLCGAFLLSHSLVAVASPEPTKAVEATPEEDPEVPVRRSSPSPTSKSRIRTFHAGRS